MSSSTASSLAFASQQVVIYIGLFIFIGGIIGGPLVLTVFLTLHTFRQNSCAFYLTVMSFVNTIHLFTGLLTFIMSNGFGINWTDMSLFYCKFRAFYVQLSILTSFTCLCLATIDQFLATCPNPRWHQWNNIKFARSMMIGAVIVWILHGIPFLLYYNHTLLPNTGKAGCAIVNVNFSKYYTFFCLACLTSTLPTIIMISFAILAYRNVKQIAHQTVPLIRRELDKQLTVMVLVQVFCDIFAVVPVIIQTVSTTIIGTPSDSFTAIQINFTKVLTGTLYYFHFVVCINCIKTSFYITNDGFLYISRVHSTYMYVYQNDFVNN
jgi:hypothetical protein